MVSESEWLLHLLRARVPLVRMQLTQLRPPTALVLRERGVYMHERDRCGTTAPSSALAVIAPSCSAAAAPHPRLPFLMVYGRLSVRGRRSRERAPGAWRAISDGPALPLRATASPALPLRSKL